MFSLSLDLEDRESKKLRWGAAVLDRLPFANFHKKFNKDEFTHLLAFANICLESQL